MEEIDDSIPKELNGIVRKELAKMQKTIPALEGRISTLINTCKAVSLSTSVLFGFLGAYTHNAVHIGSALISIFTVQEVLARRLKVIAKELVESRLHKKLLDISTAEPIAKNEIEVSPPIAKSSKEMENRRKIAPKIISERQRIVGKITTSFGRTFWGYCQNQKGGVHIASTVRELPDEVTDEEYDKLGHQLRIRLFKASLSAILGFVLTFGATRGAMALWGTNPPAAPENIEVQK